MLKSLVFTVKLFTAFVKSFSDSVAARLSELLIGCQMLTGANQSPACRLRPLRNMFIYFLILLLVCAKINDFILIIFIIILNQCLSEDTDENVSSVQSCRPDRAWLQ